MKYFQKFTKEGLSKKEAFQKAMKLLRSTPSSNEKSSESEKPSSSSSNSKAATTTKKSKEEKASTGAEGGKEEIKQEATITKNENVQKGEAGTKTEPPKSGGTATKQEINTKKAPVIQGTSSEEFNKWIEEGESNKEGSFATAIREVGKVFGNDEALSLSFAEAKEIKVTTEKPYIDFEGVHEFYEKAEKHSKVMDALNDAVDRLLTPIVVRAKRSSGLTESSDAPLHKLRKYLILLENPAFLDPEYHDIFKKLCETVSKLPEKHKDVLTNWFAQYTPKRMEELIGRIQQYITVRWYTGRQVDDLRYGTMVLGILYRANEPWRNHRPQVYLSNDEKGRGTLRTFFSRRNQDLKARSRSSNEDVKAKPLTRIITSNKGERHVPLVKATLFNNDAVNAELSLKADYRRWIENAGLSFCKFNWILDASSKRNILNIDARYQMSEHFREAMLARIYSGNIASSPYLVLRVRRNNLIRDATIQLQNARLENMTEDGGDDENNMYFKKPLKIKFEGEEGVDEGGVQKEFFQLVVAQLFDPLYGMFTYNENTRICWFNHKSISTDEEYELIGIILGLAIYNGVILDLRFPMFVYKKLLGYDATMEDMKEVDPELAKGFQKLMTFPGDVESTFCRTFTVSYQAFGATHTVELKEGGAKIPLTNDNREEYVDLYSKWYLQGSISKQFEAFRKGFMKVCGGPALRLFRPEELHLMICGTEDLDFEALEKKTQYDGGYNKDSPVIKNLWKILKRFNLEQKKKFLMFCTGSDRAPINGLGDLSFTISKNGTDTDRLPTSHTCFNHLLLPQYESEDTLEKNLLIAVQNCKGFGLL